MPYEFGIDPHRRLVYTRVSGILTVADVAQGRDALRRDPAFDPSFDLIVDLRTADMRMLSATDLRAIAVSSAFDQTSRRAIIADKNISFGLSRMYRVFRASVGGPEARGVFKTLEDALRWLNLDGFDPASLISS